MTGTHKSANINSVKCLLRARSRKTTRNAMLLWLCGLLLMALTASRHLVICQHLDGDAHIEFDHAIGGGSQISVEAAHEGGCACGHHHVDQGSGDDHPTGGHPTGGHPTGGHPTGGDPHDSCTHTDLLVDVGPEQRSETFELPKLPALAWPPCAAGVILWPTSERLALRPPATGPPIGPRRFLLQHATTQLLI